MAKIVKGKMLDHLGECDHMLICASSTLYSQSGELVMMSGVAHEVYTKFPKAAKAFGNLIKEKVGDCGFYYLMCSNKIGLFQNRVYNKNEASLAVIAEATKQLALLAEANPDKVYYLEAMWAGMPAFTCEGFVRMLPNNVTIWVPET